MGNRKRIDWETRATKWDRRIRPLQLRLRVRRRRYHKWPQLPKDSRVQCRVGQVDSPSRLDQSTLVQRKPAAVQPSTADTATVVATPAYERTSHDLKLHEKWQCYLWVTNKQCFRSSWSVIGYRLASVGSGSRNRVGEHKGVDGAGLYALRCPCLARAGNQLRCCWWRRAIRRTRSNRPSAQLPSTRRPPNVTKNSTSPSPSPKGNLIWNMSF